MIKEINAIYKGMEKWTPGQTLIKGMKICTQECAAYQSCAGQCVVETEAVLPVKCMYEVWAGYKFIKAVLEIKNEWVAVAGKTWSDKWSHLSEYVKITVLDMAINKAHIVRADIDIESNGISVVDVTKFYDPKTGVLTRQSEKLAPNPAIAVKNSLIKLNKELGETIILSEKDKDVQKRVKPTDKMPGPLGAFMEVMAKAKPVQDMVNN